MLDGMLMGLMKMAPVEGALMGICLYMIGMLCYGLLECLCSKKDMSCMMDYCKGYVSMKGCMMLVTYMCLYMFLPTMPMLMMLCLGMLMSHHSK